MAFAISSGHSQLRILFQRGLIVCKKLFEVSIDEQAGSL